MYTVIFVPDKTAVLKKGNYVIEGDEHHIRTFNFQLKTYSETHL